MEAKLTYEREFKTPLGLVRCGFMASGIGSITGTESYTNGNAETFKTEGHQIEIISFKIMTPLFNGDTLADSSGWIFRIEKTGDSTETIETYCMLDKISNEVLLNQAPGEHLDALEASHNDWMLHLGTEDAEIFNARAEIEDWFPRRLQYKTADFKSITKVKQNGFVTKDFELHKSEKIHIQYLVAYNKKDDHKESTWLAVDQAKKSLENWIGI